MISRKFSLDLDQAEIASSIRLEVTAKNVKRYPTRKCRKNGQFLFTLLCSDAGVYFLYLQLSSQFFFLLFIMPRAKQLSLTTKGAIVALSQQMKNMQRREHATSIGGLKRIALKVWRQVTPSYLEALYESMPARMQAVIAQQGGHTKY